MSQNKAYLIADILIRRGLPVEVVMAITSMNREEVECLVGENRRVEQNNDLKS
ncbi:hypothetical protein [Bacillus sp. 1P06AnD]|uniref:hypothetical protein n=1 Tax=Bacillus sp. 1P06AnD TaxID=3132208 RepID=UPI0039A2778E